VELLILLIDENLSWSHHIAHVSFSRIDVKIWNSLSCEVQQMSKSNFKNNLNDILFQRLLKCDEYIDVLPGNIGKF